MGTTSVTIPPADVEPPRSRRRRRWPARAVVVALVLAGVIVTSWPIGVTFVHNYQRTRAAVEVERTTTRAARTAPAEISAELARAMRYNATLSPRTLRDPWAKRGAAGRADQATYLSQLDLFPAMGTLTIPGIRVHLPIYHNANKVTMAHGAGHFFGTSLPIGGPGTHAVLAAHAGEKWVTMFDRLPELRIGDLFWIQILGQVLTYRVDHVTTVRPNDLDAVARVPGKDYVTLLTCTPRGVNTHRLLVRGVRQPDAAPGTTTNVTTTRRSVLQSTDLTVQHWMIPRLAFSLSVLGILALIVIGWVRGDRRRRPHRQVQAPAPAPDDGATGPRGR
jgi:sortase A